MNGPCIVTTCNRPSRSRGLCVMHYHRWLGDRSLPALDAHVPGPLDCQCETPTPTPSDMCAQCLRIIAAKVRARREAER